MLYRTLSAPLSMQVELTTKCNNTCRHCYNYQKQSGCIDSTMSVDDVRKLIKILANYKIFVVTFTGGEPMISFDSLVEGIKLCNQLGIKCSINSNLTLLSEPKLDEMMKAGNFSVLTSLASHRSEINDYLMGRTGSFEQTTNSIKMLKKKFIKVSCNMVVTKINANDVYNTGILAKSLGATSFSATKASPPLGCSDYSEVQPSKNDVRNSLSELIRLKEDTDIHVDVLECYPKCFFINRKEIELFANRRCSAGVTSGTTDPIGNIRPCSHSNRNYGNIFSEELSDIYEKMSEWRTGELLPKKCLNCSVFSICSGGCRCEAESNNSIADMDPYAEPDNVALLQSLNEKKSDSKILPSQKQIYAPNNISMRIESFGYVLFSNGNFAFIGKEAGELVYQLQKQPMNLSDCVAYSHSNVNDVTNVLNYLINRSLLRIVDERR